MNNPKTYKTNVLTLAMLAMSATALGQTVADSTQVNVAFGSKAKSELMGGVSAIDMVDLNRKNYNTYSLDALQAYAGGYTGQLWNMGDALVLVDGVPRDANNVLPTEIEQITFLKSASAVALYGSRAAKGAVLITTKRGRTDGLKVSVRGNAGLFTPKEYRAPYTPTRTSTTMLRDAIHIAIPASTSSQKTTSKKPTHATTATLSLRAAASSHTSMPTSDCIMSATSSSSARVSTTTPTASTCVVTST